MAIWGKILDAGGWRSLERLGGRTTLEILRQTGELNRAAEPERRVRRIGLLREVWGEAVRHVPFYRNCAQDAVASSMDDLSRVPVIGKEHLREGAARFVSVRVRGEPGKSVSGGSTGAPVTSYSDPAAPGIVKAAMVEGRGWWGVGPGARCLSVWGHSKYLGRGWTGRVKLLRQRLLDAVANRRVISAYNLSEARVRALHAAWCRDHPRFVIGYASALFESVRLFRKLRLDVPRYPCLVISTGEVLHEWQAEEIAEVTGFPVIEEYGLVEAGAVAYTDPEEGGLRVIGSHFVVEILDDRDDPVAMGEEGRVVVSSLWRKDVPLLRYDTGDRAVCLDAAGGRDVHRMSKVQGRTYDIIRDRAGRAIAGVIFTHAMKSVREVDRFQVVQREAGKVVIHYSAREPLADSVVEGVKRRIGSELKGELGVTIERVERLASGPSGKYRWILSLLEER